VTGIDSMAFWDGYMVTASGMISGNRSTARCRTAATKSTENVWPGALGIGVSAPAVVMGIEQETTTTVQRDTNGEY
jgi:hypothetical protein